MDTGFRSPIHFCLISESNFAAQDLRRFSSSSWRAVNKSQEMGSRRAVKPAAGALLCLGTGYAVVALSDADSDTRRRISQRASEVRLEVLLRTLSKRLQPALHSGGQTATALPNGTAAVEPIGLEAPDALYPRFYVITGPDAHLTSLARERVAARAGLHGGSNTSAVAPGSGAQAALHSERDSTLVDVVGRPAVRLGVPYGCTLRSGEFSSLLEQQLLRQPHDLLADHGQCDGVSPTAPHALRGDRGRDGAERVLDGLQQGCDEEQQRGQPDMSTDWESPVDEVDRNLNEDQERGSPPSPTATTQTTPLEVVSTWDSFLLWATSAVLHGSQLDDTALVALERVLTESYPAAAAGGASSSPGDQSSSFTIYDSSADHTDLEESLQPASPVSPPIPPSTATGHGGSSCNFVLEIGRPRSLERGDRERGKAAARTMADDGRRAGGSESAALCGNLARWGWKLASRRLATVLVR